MYWPHAVKRYELATERYYGTLVSLASVSGHAKCRTNFCRWGRQVRPLVSKSSQSSIYLNRANEELDAEMHERKKLHQQLEDFNRQLEKTIEEKTRLLIAQATDHQRQLLQATIEGQEKERKQIGMELHDNVNQVLAGVGLYLDIGMNTPELKDEMIARSKEQIQAAIHGIRSLSKALVPYSIENGEPTESILDMIAPIEVSRNITFHVGISEAAANQLTMEQMIAVYRIVQEQLTNILKYAAASNVFIELYKDDETVQLVVRDNGKGFDAEQRRPGIGLSNIESGTAVLNGEMQIASAPARGCELKVRFPSAVPVQQPALDPAHLRNKAIPFVFISTNASAHAVREAHVLGVQVFLKSPAIWKVLKACSKDYLITGNSVSISIIHDMVSSPDSSPGTLLAFIPKA
ncbi:MAG TPA: sensor histidine kinase [Flavisolibacter sp.]|nr:sensor histidine kinase [Flavisolibacter sp.]